MHNKKYIYFQVHLPDHSSDHVNKVNLYYLSDYCHYWLMGSPLNTPKFWSAFRFIQGMSTI